ncbi:MAG: response regulator [Anaerolineae bacterium]|jgi:CheY-like chemotaxis protein
MLSDEQVIDAVQGALRQLYDSQALRGNPLVAALGLADSQTAASELNQVITEAIHALRPDAAVPPEAGAWRIYEILEYRFLQQVGQIELARQLGLSVRHLRREEHRAIEMLAQALRPLLLSRGAERNANAEELVSAGTDLAWIGEHGLASQVDIAAAVSEAVGLAHPLAVARRIAVEVDVPPAPVVVSMQPVALREMILQLLTAVICHTTDSSMRVQVRPSDQAVEIEIEAAWQGLRPEARAECQYALQMARQIARRCGVAVEANLESDCFTATLTLPQTPGVPVLVIDDNEDALRLLRRYAVGTPFRILSASTLTQGLVLAAQTRPQIIVLDVLMPNVDGWQVLAQLLHHPLTMQAPILVCSILTQEELALSLGASAYLRKPVTRQAFLQALERHLRRAEPAPKTAF